MVEVSKEFGVKFTTHSLKHYSVTHTKGDKLKSSGLTSQMLGVYDHEIQVTEGVI